MSVDSVFMWVWMDVRECCRVGARAMFVMGYTFAWRQCQSQAWMAGDGHNVHAPI